MRLLLLLLIAALPPAVGQSGSWASSPEPEPEPQNASAWVNASGPTPWDEGDCDIDTNDLSAHELKLFVVDCELSWFMRALLDWCYEHEVLLIDIGAVSTFFCCSIVLSTVLPAGRPKYSNLRAAEYARKGAIAKAQREADEELRAQRLDEAKALVERGARLKFVAWHLFFPLVCLGHSIQIFVKPCLLSYALGACGRFWIAVGEKMCCCCNCKLCRKRSFCICFRFEDTDFPASSESIGLDQEFGAPSSSAARAPRLLRSVCAEPADTASRGSDWLSAMEVCDDLDETVDEQIVALSADPFNLGGQAGPPKPVERMKLFQGEIEPADVAQGQLGDCWLMTAIVCLTEFRGAIQSCFLTAEYNPRGRYCVRLYCAREKQFKEIVVDNRIPVVKGTSDPAFAKPNGREMWVMLLEKAFAKFVGSYAALDGGYALWGLQAMTGDEVANFALDVKDEETYAATIVPASGLHSSQDDSDIVAGRGERLWGEYEIRADPERPDDRLAIDFYKKRSKGKHVTYTTGGFFELLRLWDQEESLISASTSGEDEGTETAVEGLVQGHAYAVISVVEVIQMIGTENLKMLRLRNPWGSFEWTGAWCDGDPRWLQNPRAVEACTARHTDAEEGIAGQVKDDGLFWYAAPHPPRRRPFCPVALAEQSCRRRMEYNDFMKHFTMIDMCHRSRGIADVRIDLHEDLGCTGPARGCAQVRQPPRLPTLDLHLQTTRACCVQGCCQFYCPYPSLRAPHCRGCNGCKALCCPALHTHGADYETLDESVELP